MRSDLLYLAYFQRFRGQASLLLAVVLATLTIMAGLFQAPPSPPAWIALLLIGPVPAWLAMVRPNDSVTPLWGGLGLGALLSVLYRSSEGALDLLMVGFPIITLYREVGPVLACLLGILLDRLLQGPIHPFRPQELWWWMVLYTALTLMVAVSTQREVRRVSKEQSDLARHHERRNQRHMEVQVKRHEVLHSVLERVTELCEQVVHSTRSLSDLGQRQGQDRSLASAVQGIAGSSSLIQTTCQKLALSLSSLAGQASQTHETVEGSEELLISAQEQVARIRAAARVVLERLELLLHRTERVRALVGNIHKISDRVALLALHAAMEAERAAGAHEDFRYVAGEIRRLADRTEVATLEVTRILHEMHSEVKQNLESMEQFGKEVDMSQELLAQLLGQMQDSQERVSMVDRRFTRVSELLSGQTIAVEQIRKSVEGLSLMHDQNAQALLDTKDVLSTLQETTQNLNWAVSGLR